MDEIAGALRGVASFGLDVVTDPASYFTFGLAGVGKKAAVEISETVVKKAAKESLEGLSRPRCPDGHP